MRDKLSTQQPNFDQEFGMEPPLRTLYPTERLSLFLEYGSKVALISLIRWDLNTPALTT